MNILRVSSDLYPFVTGGIGIHVHEMSRVQAQCGHKVTVITSGTDKKIIPHFVNNYEIIHFNDSFKVFGNSISLNFLFKLIKEQKNYDLIHAHSHLFFTTNVCAALRRINSTPVIITNHGLISQSVPDWIQRLFIPTVAKWTFNAVDKIICYSIYEKEQLVDLGVNPKKISVIHNGINTDIFVPKEDRIRSKNILWVGRYAPGKGVFYLLDAFALTLKNHPDAHLTMIGDGPQKKLIQQKIKTMALFKYITMEPFVSNEDLPNIYQNSDILVLPSLNEGIPRTLLEAMASGIPVVCSDLPQLHNLVNGAGILVPTRDPEAIASAIIKILENAEFSLILGKKARYRIAEEYSWNDTVEKTLLLYEEVLCRT